MMCVIDSDYIYEGGSGNPQGKGFLSISMLFIQQKNNTGTLSLHANLSRLHIQNQFD